MRNEHQYHGSIMAGATGKGLHPGLFSTGLKDRREGLEKENERLRAELKMKDQRIKHLEREVSSLKDQVLQLSGEIHRMQVNTPLIII